MMTLCFWKRLYNFFSSSSDCWPLNINDVDSELPLISLALACSMMNLGSERFGLFDDFKMLNFWDACFDDCMLGFLMMNFLFWELVWICVILTFDELLCSLIMMMISNLSCFWYAYLFDSVMMDCNSWCFGFWNEGRPMFVQRFVWVWLFGMACGLLVWRLLGLLWVTMSWVYAGWYAGFDVCGLKQVYWLQACVLAWGWTSWGWLRLEQAVCLLDTGFERLVFEIYAGF